MRLSRILRSSRHWTKLVPPYAETGRAAALRRIEMMDTSHLPSGVTYAAITVSLHIGLWQHQENVRKGFYFRSGVGEAAYKCNASAAWPHPASARRSAAPVKVPVLDIRELPGGDVLKDYISGIPSATEALEIHGDTPGETDWQALGQRFDGIQSLLISTGESEGWTDASIPTHWPLQTLVVGDAAGEVVKTPFILEGQVQQLCFVLTVGMRFEGPTRDELAAAAHDKVQTAYKRAQEAATAEGKATPDAKGLVIYYVPDNARELLEQKYEGQELKIRGTRPPDGSPESRLRSLEIIENDAIDTFHRFALARPYIIAGLDSLCIRSMEGRPGTDLYDTPEELLGMILQEMDALKELNLALRTISNREMSTILSQKLPTGLESLKIRARVDLVDNKADWESIRRAFNRKEYLPSLKRVSFVLDLNEDFDNPPSLEALTKAKKAVTELLDVLGARGVMSEQLYDHWPKICEVLEAPDERWHSLPV